MEGSVGETMTVIGFCHAVARETRRKALRPIVQRVHSSRDPVHN